MPIFAESKTSNTEFRFSIPRPSSNTSFAKGGRMSGLDATFHRVLDTVDHLEVSAS